MASILTVDDSISTRQMVAFTLRRDGHEVSEAEDGMIALDMARERDFDLVITDFNMPNMDGITLISELRGLPGFEATPLLMLTSDSTDDSKQAGRLAGATGWIVKPFSPDQLLAVIERVLP